MAFDTQNINIQTKKILGVGEFAVSTKINIDPEKALKKVLSVKAFAEQNAAEQIDTDYTVNGRTQLSVVYLTENNTLESVVGFADFQASTKINGTATAVQIMVKEITQDSVSASELSLSVLHNFVVEGLSKETFSVVSNLSEDYVSQTQNVNYRQICATSAEKFVVSENLEINANRVLNADAYVKVKNVLSGIDQVSIDGEIDVKILYATDGGTNLYTKTLDFKREIACMGALPDALCYAQLKVGCINAELEMGEKTFAKLDISLDAIADVYENKELTVVTDVYSLTQNVETTVECVENSSFAQAKYINDTVVCGADISTQSVDEVVAVLNPVVELSHVSVNAGSAIIEGVVNSTLIYKDNETQEIKNMNLSCPFVSKTDAETCSNIEDVFVTCGLSSVKIRSGKELEIVLDVQIGFAGKQNSYFEYVKSILEVGEKEVSNSAITIYVTKENESIYSVAKALNVLPETIINQNEIVDGKFAKGQRIFVYSPLNVEF